MTQVPGEAPTIPVLYWHCPEKLSVSSLFVGLLENLQNQATRGRIPELRERLFLASYRFSRLGSEELQAMTALWEEHVLQFPEPSNLTSAKAQIANQACCHQHQRSLLSTCPRCRSAFQLPSYWQNGE